MNSFEILTGTPEDLLGVVDLYDTLNDALARGINHPGWKKGIYPNKDTAIEGIDSRTLYVMKDQDKIVGTIILNHVQPEAYAQLDWQIKGEENQIIVIHTLAVHPDYFKFGIGSNLVKFAEVVAKEQACVAIRLDVFNQNLPAVRLYEKNDYQFVGEVDLGLNIPDLVMFKCYEKRVV